MLKGKRKETFIIRLSNEAIVETLDKSPNEAMAQLNAIIEQARVEGEPLEEVNIELIRALYAVIYERLTEELETISAKKIGIFNKANNAGNPITIKASELLRKTGAYDPDKDNALRIYAEIKKMSDLYGVISQEGQYEIRPLISIEGFTPVDMVITCSPKHLDCLAAEIAKRSAKKLEKYEDSLRVSISGYTNQAIRET